MHPTWGIKVAPSTKANEPREAALGRRAGATVLARAQI